MKGTDLVAEFRTLATDTVEPYLWPDEFVLPTLIEAEREAAERSLLIYDDSTVTVTQLAVTENIDTYAVSNLIVSVERATFVRSNGETVPLSVYDREKLGRQSRAHRLEDDAWFGTVPGIPSGLIYDGKVLQSTRMPSEDGTILLGVYRLPLAPFTLATEPEIPPIYHKDLVEWALFRAFTIPDADGKNADLATLHLDLFEQRFGKRPAAGEIIRQRAIKPRYGTKCWW